ncbi:M3 family metallopeptidase [Fangia hongkongensis]|uniref:M3 family metallopeptidase n=2 Tax=Fangia hongkongensis TaxID=270495 RepID=UPI000369F59C|nr:M3 family metallopeptidase [Fangia hongkongensis]
MTEVLIQKYETELPIFSALDINKAEEEIKEIIAFCQKTKEALLTQKHYTWQNFVYPLEVAEDTLSKAFTPISHLNAVQNTPELRAVYQSTLELISAYNTESLQDERLLKAYKIVLESDETLDEVQKKALNDVIRDFKLSGVDLAQKERQKFKEMSIKLSQLQSQFENNVLDATMKWQYETTDENELSGLSNEVIYAAKEKAKTLGKNDSYVLGIDPPTYLAVLQQADNKALREKFYHAYNTRASELFDYPEYDNTALMSEILELREAQAKLLQMDSHAEVSIASKMASSVDEVEGFLLDLLHKTKAQAKNELAELQSFVKTLGVKDDLAPWDIAYYSEKLKKKAFDFTEDELRPFFPLSQVSQGLFDILRDIYGLEAKKEVSFDRYNEDIALYSFYDAKGKLRGKIITDLFARENKRGGAWMDEARVRYKHKDGSIQLPVAYVNCNFMPPQEGKEALLTHNDVLTLFHEFGHALHHVLTLVDYPSVSGINGVEWDAVELPSQFMENFCWCKEGLEKLSKHVETGKMLPQHLFDRLVASREFQSALAMVRQLEFAIFDIRLHKAHADNVNVHAILDEVRKETAVIMPPEYNRFENSFSHIFAGGYAAGYYSYKWAEVLSSDAFAMFEESGELLNSDVGTEFLSHILEKGGSSSAAKLFHNLRGRDPEVNALLRHSGIKSV